MRFPPGDDESRQLLTGGAGTLATGLLAALLTVTIFGGVDGNGAHSNPGWILLLVSFGCLLCGFIAVTLGAARWFRMRRTNARWAGVGGVSGPVLLFRPGRMLRPAVSRMAARRVSRRGGSLLSFSEHARGHRTHGKERQ